LLNFVDSERPTSHLQQFGVLSKLASSVEKLSKQSCDTAELATSNASVDEMIVSRRAGDNGGREWAED
jgi:hypothetical protein